MPPFDAPIDALPADYDVPPTVTGRKKRIAVVGSGAAGLGAAWALDRRHDVVLYDSDRRAGGHADTAVVEMRDRLVSVDTGFIVFNTVNYPNLTRLFDALDVPTERSDMSFAVSMDGGRFEYKGSASGLLASKRNLLDPRIYGMVVETLRFYRNAPRLLEDGYGDVTLGEYLRRENYSRSFIDRHLIPMGAAIWSCRPSEMLEFPARSFVRFCMNHGLLTLVGRPQWRTVSGGSREYVVRILAGLKNPVRLSRRVVRLHRGHTGVLVFDSAGGIDRFDEVVLACHADHALTLLGDGTTVEEHSVLGAFRYSSNRAVLHSDPSLMPRRKSAWASWNYLEGGRSPEEQGLCVTYWMNRLQNIDPSLPLFVTLNPVHEPKVPMIHKDIVYDHPQFDTAAIEAQAKLPSIQGVKRTWFCGSYCGYGFHEDAIQSGLAVAAALGAPAPWADEIMPVNPSANVARANTLAAE